MDEFVKLLPSLPQWLSIPLILLTVVAVVWPKVVQTVREGGKQRRAYELEKQRLELLRLRYEIEVLRKQHGLLEILPEVTVSETAPAIASVPQNDIPPLGSFQRFLYGALGAVVPIVLQLVLVHLADVFADVTAFLLLGYSIRLIVFMTLAGVASWLLPRSIASKRFCFLTGFSTTLLLTMLLQYGLRTEQVTPPDVVGVTGSVR